MLDGRISFKWEQSPADQLWYTNIFVDSTKTAALPLGFNGGAVQQISQWNGINSADDYRFSNILMYCHPDFGNLGEHNFPEFAGIFWCVHLFGFSWQMYVTGGGSLYVRVAPSNTATYTSWLEK